MFDILNLKKKLTFSIKDHIDEMTSIALHSELSTSTIAFNYMRNPQPEVTQAFLSGYYLQPIAIQMLAQSDTLPISLYRTAHLTLFTLSENPKKFPKNCGFIIQFLSFIHELCIIDFFERLCGEDSINFESTQNWLKDINFSSFVANEMDKEKPITEDEYVDQSVQRMRNLFRLVRVCLRSPILRESFQTVEIYDSLKSTMLNMADTIEAERWQTFIYLYCQETREMMRELIFSAFNIVSTPCTEYKAFRVSALNLLTLMILKDLETHTFFIDFKFHEVLLRLMFSFPAHSFLNMAIMKFVRCAMKMPTLQNYIIDSLMMPIIIEGAYSEHTVLKGVSFSIITESLIQMKTNPAITEKMKGMHKCAKFINTVMAPRLDLLKNNYGGPAPIIWGAS